MKISEQIHDRLLVEYRDGKKQTELAKLHNVSQQYMCRLLSGKRSCEDITLKTMEKMFPQATLNLNGNGITQFASNVSVRNGNVNSIELANAKSAESFRNEAVSAIIKLDLNGDDLKKVLTALLGIEV